MLRIAIDILCGVCGPRHCSPIDHGDKERRGRGRVDERKVRERLIYRMTSYHHGNNIREQQHGRYLHKK